MTSTLALSLIFLSVALLVIAVWSAVHDRFFRHRMQVQERLANVFSPEKETPQRTPLFRDLKALQAQTAQEQRSLWNQFITMVEQSGLSIPPARVPLTGSVLGLLLAAAIYTFTSLPWLVLPAGVLGFILPFLFVAMKRQARIQKLCQQLPGALDQMKRAVRAGQSVAGAMQLVSTDLRAPLAEEFGICCQQQGLGLPYRTALRDLAHRTGVMELQILTVALLVQQESGGNCVEVLSHLSDTVRKRLHLAGRVKALTSEGRLQAIVLSLLPVAAFVAILFINPSYAQVLLERPLLLVGVAVSEIAGILWIRQIVNIEY